MFDKYMIVGQGFRNRSEGGKVAGFEFGARLPYSRDLGLAMGEIATVELDRPGGRAPGAHALELAERR